MISTPSSGHSSIAIIGMWGRFPHIRTVEEFWSLLKQEDTTVKTIDRATLKYHGRTDQEMDNSAFVSVGGHMDEVDRFDGAFFGLTDQEASFMDPQLRIMLETAWHIFEDAGKDPYRHSAYTGVFASTRMSTYLFRNLAHEFNSDSPSKQTLSLILNGQDYGATWIAYKLGLNGPAMNIQTACSSGLANVIVACQHLLDHTCDMALAISGAITVPQYRGYMSDPDSIVVSQKGMCRPFDSEADGTVFADGVVGFLLRRLDDAIADGDRIIAVIPGFGINNDGKRKPSHIVLSVEGQTEAMAQALTMANLNPSDIEFIEAHGPGTYLGDPIEFTALHKTYGEIKREKPCLIGAVKGNIGHTGEAAGACGLFKAALAVSRGEIPPNINFKSLNPHIAAIETSLKIANTFQKWESGGSKRRAAVNALGIGGTNCHILVEEAPIPPSYQQLSAVTEFTLTFSARSPDALVELRERYLELLKTNPSQERVASLCYTALQGRAQLPWQLTVHGQSAESLGHALRTTHLPTAPIAHDSPERATSIPPPAGWAELPKYPFADTRYWINPQPHSYTEKPMNELSLPHFDPETQEEDALIGELKTLWSERLNTSVEADGDFFDLGGDSIRAVLLLADIEKSIGIRLPLTIFIEARTVRSLAQVIEKAFEEAPQPELV